VNYKLQYKKLIMYCTNKGNTQGRNSEFMTAGTYNSSTSNTRKCIKNKKSSRSTAGHIVIEECFFCTAGTYNVRSVSIQENEYFCFSCH
jgi:hypothetical protein